MVTAADLSGASAADVAAARSALAAYLQALYPTRSLAAGPMADLVLGPAADALAAVEHRGAALEVAVDPAAALAAGGYDETLLASVLAGRGVARLPAAKAAGSAALVFTSLAAPLTVPAGFRLRAVDGVYYAVSSATRILPAGQTATFSNEVVAVDDGAGHVAGLVPVAAEAAGAAGNRTAGSALTAVTSLTNLDSAYAATALSGGRDAETDAELLARLPAATAPRTAASAAGALGALQAAVPAASDAKLLGFGHAGMYRGRSVLSSQSPGRADLRYRTAEAPATLRIAVTATLQAAGPPGTWQFSLTRDQAPGRYLVEKVLPTSALLTAAGYAPTLVTPGYDVSGVTNPPDVRSAADAAGSRYATATVRFNDPDTATGSLTVGVSTKSYDAVVRAVPHVAEGQAALDAEGVAAAGTDCLVRAANPVMTAATGTFALASGVTATADEVASAVARAVNAQPIGSTLSGSAVLARAQSYLPAGVSLRASAWSGTVYAGDGTTSSISGSDGLAVGTDWALGLGDDAVAYYADAADMTFTEA